MKEDIKLTSQEEIDEAIKKADVKPLDLKEPSVQVRMESNTEKLPRHIRLTRNDLGQTKIYKRMDIQDDIESSTDRYNHLLNIALVIMIAILTLLIIFSVVLGLDLLGVI